MHNSAFLFRYKKDGNFLKKKLFLIALPPTIFYKQKLTNNWFKVTTLADLGILTIAKLGLRIDSVKGIKLFILTQI